MNELNLYSRTLLLGRVISIQRSAQSCVFTCTATSAWVLVIVSKCCMHVSYVDTYIAGTAVMCVGLGTRLCESVFGNPGGVASLVPRPNGRKHIV